MTNNAALRVQPRRHADPRLLDRRRRLARHRGAGTLYLSGTNTYTGGTTVANGTLIATNSDWVDPTGIGTSLFVGNDLSAFGGVISADATSRASQAAASPAITPVPEPGTLALLVAGAAVAAWLWKSRQKAGGRR